MHKIDSASALARFASSCPNDSLRPLLEAKADLLADHDDLATFVIVEVTDTPDDLGRWPAPEIIETFGGWTVITIILSDDGEGIILFVPDNADPMLVAAILESER
jgi:hypothetical protein